MGLRIHAFSDDAMGTMDATALAGAIARGEVSEQEVLEAAIARAEKVNPYVNAIVIKMYDEARRRVGRLPKNKLYGVPTFVKDTDAVAGYPTQLGTGAFKARIPARNSKFIQQYFFTGMNCLGKTTLPEFGLICSTENPRWGITRNPWNTDYTTGGSSSGSAALVAAGVVPIAMANDGGGSIRIPAAICGLVGLKPSRHRLHGVDGGALLPIQIIHQGVLTRTVRDTALFLAEAEKFYRHKKLPPLGFVEGPSKKRLRIATVANLPPGTPGHQDEDTQRAISETIHLLESLGHRVDTVPLPIDANTMIDHFLHYYGFMSYIVTHWSIFTLGSKVDHSLLEPFTTGLYKVFKKNPSRLIPNIRTMRRIVAKANTLFDTYDVVLTPVLSHKTPPIGYLSPDLPEEEIIRRVIHFATYTGLNNVSGAPGISLPLSTDSNDLPLGMHFSARYGNDRLLLELAYELEAAKPWRMMYQTKTTQQ
ncbi:MAG: amidase [Chitinophagales bacterium]|nr:amidase [Chitinophagales bacterium]MDW8419197.1 amidase [Chitinophagales bacterium]